MLTSQDLDENIITEQEAEQNEQQEVKETEDIKPIALVITSRNDGAANADAIRQLQLSALFPVHPYFYQNNQNIPMTQVYNQILAQTTEDIVVFMHDDAEILTAGWARTLWSLFRENPDFGIIGVAGSKDYDEDGAWWIYKNIYGQVFHRQEVKDDKGNVGYTTFRTDFSEELYPGHLEEVCIIDGLFMALHKKRTDISFDNAVGGFNFYDVNFCLDNFKAKKTKIGVTTDIHISHRGLGIIRPEWYVNRAVAMDKYKDILPISNLQCNTPTEDKRDIPAFKPENDPWKNGQIKLMTKEEMEAAQKAEEEAKNNATNAEQNGSKENNGQQEG